MTEQPIIGSAPDVGDRGRTIIEDVVVTKIAGIAARDVTGVHDLGGGAGRFAGAVRERIPGAGVDVRQGIAVEVGDDSVSVDVTVIAEFGVAIHELADAIRENVIVSVERMTGLNVVAVDVTIHDVMLPDEDYEEHGDAEPRSIRGR